MKPWTVKRHTKPTKVDVLVLHGVPICRFYAGRADEALIAKMLRTLNTEPLYSSLVQAVLSLKAIGEPGPNVGPADAEVCGFMARGALVRIKECLPEEYNQGTLRMLLGEGS
jgi:hypothetical protein